MQVGLGGIAGCLRSGKVGAQLRRLTLHGSRLPRSDDVASRGSQEETEHYAAAQRQPQHYFSSSARILFTHALPA